jgi:hypothetical protein
VEAFMRPGQLLRTRIDEWSRRAMSLIDAGSRSEWATLWEAARQNIRTGPEAAPGLDLQWRVGSEPGVELSEVIVARAQIEESTDSNTEYWTQAS